MEQPTSSGSASPMELEFTCAELKRLFLSPLIASEVTSFVFKVVHHSCLSEGLQQLPLRHK